MEEQLQESFTPPKLILLVEDDPIVPIGAAALRSSKWVKNATLKIYKGAPHGLAYRPKDKRNATCWHLLRPEVALSSSRTKEG